MASELAHALALAIAKASLEGDAATVRVLLSAAASANGPQTFADGQPTKRGWGVKSLINWLTGRKDAAKHQAEHERQIAGFQPDEVLPAETLTGTELKVWNGELVHTPTSSCVYSIRYDRGDGQGNKTRTFITFKPSGDVYVYFDVPFNVVMDEIQTDSSGRGIWRWFREGTPPYKSLYGGRKVGSVTLSKAEGKKNVIHILRQGKKKP